MAKALQITARPATGFRRCGIHHPPTPTLHALGKFKKEQIEALKKEPNLIVAEVEADAKELKAGASEGAGESQ